MASPSPPRRISEVDDDMDVSRDAAGDNTITIKYASESEEDLSSMSDIEPLHRKKGEDGDIFHHPHVLATERQTVYGRIWRAIAPKYLFPDTGFRILRVQWAIVTQIVVLILFEALALVPRQVQPDMSELEKEIDLPSAAAGKQSAARYLIAHVVVTFVLLVAAKILAAAIRSARLAGYLQFHRTNHCIAGVPSAVFSFANMGHLLIATLWPTSDTVGAMPKIAILQTIFTVEFLIGVSASIVLLVRVREFNRIKPTPDAIKEISDISSIDWLDFGTEESSLSKVIDKQADLIRFLEHQRKQLGRQAIFLSERIHELESSENLQNHERERKMLQQRIIELMYALEERDGRIGELTLEVGNLRSRLHKNQRR